MRNAIGVLLAGGQGERLWPLTRDRAKPAVPFGGIYRIIDVTLSNCLNSDLRRVFVLTQYKSLSLNRHVRRGWSALMGHGEFIEILTPQMRVSQHWYQGTADAVYQNIYSIGILPMALAAPACHAGRMSCRTGPGQELLCL
jgi:glucose-1-phosphate adenylyltransferase